MSERICMHPDCAKQSAPRRRWCDLHARKAICTIQGCDRPVKGHGLCESHLRKLKRWGTPTPTKQTAEERFWTKVDKSGEHWMWTASTRAGGYGQFFINGKLTEAHRAAYEFAVGPIPDGLTIDHLCYIRGCVNPSHLEAVTIAENVRREVKRRWTGESPSFPIER